MVRVKKMPNLYVSYFRRMRRGYEIEEHDLIQEVRPPDPIDIMRTPFKASEGKRSGRARLNALLKQFYSFKVIPAAHQRDLLIQMTISQLPFIMGDDLNQEMETLCEEFGIDDINLFLIAIAERRAGKCLGPDVLVRLFDNTTKKAKEVQVGDLLLGDDECPRLVLELVSGYAFMYSVEDASDARPELTFTCNGDHMLVVKHKGVTITESVRTILQYTDDDIEGICSDGSTYPMRIRDAGFGKYSGFHCASFDESLTLLEQRAIATLYKSHELDEHNTLITHIFLHQFLHISTEDGSASPDGAFPGRFVLANGVVTHNSWTTAMNIAASALALEAKDGEPFVQSIVSASQRQSTKMLDLVKSFICQATGEDTAGYVSNATEIKIKGSMGQYDYREIYSYPCNERVSYFFDAHTRHSSYITRTLFV